jgi:hypothetical protein
VLWTNIYVYMLSGCGGHHLIRVFSIQLCFCHSLVSLSHFIICRAGTCYTYRIYVLGTGVLLHQLAYFFLIVQHDERESL